MSAVSASYPVIDNPCIPVLQDAEFHQALFSLDDPVEPQAREVLAAYRRRHPRQFLRPEWAGPATIAVMAIYEIAGLRRKMPMEQIAHEYGVSLGLICKTAARLRKLGPLVVLEGGDRDWSVPGKVRRHCYRFRLRWSETLDLSPERRSLAQAIRAAARAGVEAHKVSRLGHGCMVRKLHLETRLAEAKARAVAAIRNREDGEGEIKTRSDEAGLPATVNESRSLESKKHLCTTPPYIPPSGGPREGRKESSPSRKVQTTTTTQR